MIGPYPEQTVAFCHPLHESLPDDQRPTFHARFITARESMRVNAHLDRAFRAEKADNAQEAGGEAEYDPTHRETLIRELVALLQLTVAGWDNLAGPDGSAVEPTPDGFDTLPDLFELGDLWDLYAAATAATRMRRDDLKKSASPSPDSGDGSAPTADAEEAAESTGATSGGASTNHQPPSPPSSNASPATTAATTAPTAADAAKS